MKIEVTTTVDVDINEVWEHMWGNDGNGIAYWCYGVRDVVDGERQDSFHAWKRGDDGKILEVNGSWIPDPHDFAVLDNYEDAWKLVTVGMLANAYAKLKAEGATHCWGHPLFDDPDSCTEDALLQTAIFGELVYG